MKLQPLNFEMCLSSWGGRRNVLGTGGGFGVGIFYA